MSDDFIQSQAENVQDLVESLISELKETTFQSGKIEASFHQNELPRFTNELTAILSLTTCKKSQNIDKKASKRHIIHLAITETGCTRHGSSSSIFIPITNIQNSIIQTFKDMIDMHTLTWNSMIMLYDHSTDPSLINDLKLLLSSQIPTAEFDLGTNPEDSIMGILRSLPHKLSNQFLVLSKESDVSSIANAADQAGLTTLDHQWLYVVTDTNRESEMLPKELSNAKDGQHVAFLFNSSSNPESQNNCQGGILCFTEELIRTFASSLKETLEAQCLKISKKMSHFLKLYILKKLENETILVIFKHCV